MSGSSDKNNTAKDPVKTPWPLVLHLLIFIILCLFIGIVGYHYLTRQISNSKYAAEKELSAIGNLKAQQISVWYNELLENADFVMNIPSLADSVETLIKDPFEEKARRELKYILQESTNKHSCTRALLLDKDQNVILCVPEIDPGIGPTARIFAERTIDTSKTLISDLHSSKRLPGRIDMDIFVPISKNIGDTSKAIAVIMFEISPHSFLFPAIQAWPSKSATAETLLIRRESNDVVYLNTLRHSNNVPIQFRLPIDKHGNLPAARAALGVKGVVEGTDYRNKPVLADVRAVDNTPWFMVAKIDQDEIYSSLHKDAKIICFALLCSLIASAMGVGYLWQRFDKRRLSARIQADHESRLLAERNIILNKYANDIIIISDNSWNIIDINERALQTYGYTREEFFRLNASDLRAPESVSDFDEFKRKLKAEGSILTETIHKRRDGSTFPIEISSKAIEVQGKAYYLAIIRDITERKKAESIIKESESNLRAIIESNPIGIHMYYLNNKDELIFDGANPSADKILGMDHKKLIGLTIEQAFPGLKDTDIPPTYRSILKKGIPRNLGNIKYADSYFEVDAFLSSQNKLVVMFSDITIRKLNEDILKAERDLSFGMSRTASLQETLKQCLDTIIDISGMDSGGMYIVSDNGGLELIIHKGLSEGFIKAVSHYEPDDVNTGLVMKGQPLYAAHSDIIRIDASKMLRNESLKALAIIPVIDHNKVTASINVASHSLASIPEWAQTAMESIASRIGPIIAHAQTIEKLQHKTEELDRYFNSSLDLLCIADVEGHVSRLNPEWEKVLGYGLDEIKSRSIIDFVHPDDKQATINVMASLSSQKAVLNFIHRFRCKDGSYRSLEWRAYPSGRTVFAIARDITEQKKFEEALRESETKYRALVENSLIGIGVSSDDKIIYANTALMTMYGYTDFKEFSSKPLTEYLTPQSRDLIRDWRDRKARGEPISKVIEHDIIRKDGTIRTLRLNIEKVVIGLKEYVYTTFFDITDQKHAEEREKDLQAKLARLQRQESLSILAGGVAHDLNNILGPIVLLPDILQDYLAELSPAHSKLADESKDILNDMKLAASRAAAIVKDLASLSGGSKYEKTPIDINSLSCLSAESDIAATIRKSHPEITLNYNIYGSSLMIMGSEAHIDRIIINLMNNAVEAIEDRGSVSVESTMVTLDSDFSGYENIPAGTYATISVKDTGCGIPVKNMGHIFEPFFTKKIKAGKSGTGLGLSIVHSIVKEHEGYIHVTSKPGKGTTFTLYFPVIESVPGVEKPAAATTAPHGTENILVVDDEPSQRTLARRALEKIGYTISTADNGNQAIEMVKKNLSADKPFDLIILDMIMDDVHDGLRTLNGILKLNPRQKALIASGHADKRQVETARMLGVTWLAKPYDFKQLAIAVRNVLDNKTGLETQTKTQKKADPHKNDE